jgi:hypothetical protein
MSDISWLIVNVPRLEYVDPRDFDDEAARSGGDPAPDRTMALISERWAPEIVDHGVFAVASDGDALRLRDDLSWFRIRDLLRGVRVRHAAVLLDELVAHCGPEYCGRVRVARTVSYVGSQAVAIDELRPYAIPVEHGRSILPSYADLMEAVDDTAADWTQGFLRVDDAGTVPRLPAGHAGPCRHQDPQRTSRTT